MYCLLLAYEDLFARDKIDFGRTQTIRHAIKIGDATPIRQHIRCIAPDRRKETQKLLQDMLKKDVIKSSTSLCASPIVLVRKKDGLSRFCIAYHKVNAVTWKDAYSYPVPRVDDIIPACSLQPTVYTCLQRYCYDRFRSYPSTRCQLPVYPLPATRLPVASYPSTRCQLPVYPLPATRLPVASYPSTRCQLPVYPLPATRLPVASYPLPSPRSQPPNESCRAILPRARRSKGYMPRPCRLVPYAAMK